MGAAQQDCRPKDCYDLKCYRVSNAKDGPHSIYPSRPELKSLAVSCDQETDGGGWIMYQRRVDGSVNFTRNWEEYKYGFGDHGDNTTELWLGNEHVYQLVHINGSTVWELRIEADAFDGTSCWLVASGFRMNRENNDRRYALDWDNVTESAARLANDWNSHKLKPFVTFDEYGRYYDSWSTLWYSRALTCITRYKGGWWFARINHCNDIFLNGQYENETGRGDSRSIYVYSFKRNFALERSRMMFRPQNDVRPCNNPCKNGGTCEYNVATNSSKCWCIAEFSGSTCESTYTDTNSGADSDAHNDADSDADSDADGDAYNDADSDEHSDAGSDVHSDADVDAYSVTGSDANSDVHSDADSDVGNNTESVSGSTLQAAAGGISLLLLLILIAGAIVVGATRRQKQRDAELNCPKCEVAYSDEGSDEYSDAGNSSRSDTTPETG